jgi:hypothetical protein
MTSDTAPVPLSPRERALSIAVPVTSFGGIGVALLLQQFGIVADAGRFTWGCVLGAFLLGYLAFGKPKRDIVALCAPLYAFLIFVIPLEITPTLILQFLFAASITILVVRLNMRFSPPARVPGGLDPMEKFLIDYIERMRPHFRSIAPATAHDIASAFLSYKFGLYGKTAEESTHAIAALPAGGAMDVLKKALRIVNERAMNLMNANYTPGTSLEFTDTERPYLAVNLPAEHIEDQATLHLENALLLIYAAAYVSSEDDEATLDEQQKFAINILESYKTALMMRGQ